MSPRLARRLHPISSTCATERCGPERECRMSFLGPAYSPNNRRPRGISQTVHWILRSVHRRPLSCTYRLYDFLVSCGNTSDKFCMRLCATGARTRGESPSINNENYLIREEQQPVQGLPPGSQMSMAAGGLTPDSLLSTKQLYALKLVNVPSKISASNFGRFSHVERLCAAALSRPCVASIIVPRRRCPLAFRRRHHSIVSTHCRQIAMQTTSTMMKRIYFDDATAEIKSAIRGPVEIHRYGVPRNNGTAKEGKIDRGKYRPGILRITYTQCKLYETAERLFTNTRAHRSATLISQ